ncbi:uncharacterized protein LOC117916256 [Vitis riparia]|uniref:uncharacterized protein LOC117916256 n=1 Tax=Vitis riparia TaxID=96939 RepID=UPI00155A5328|nr:uncharacterized protein LOC117916256 [Vitis riparia]
MATKQFFILKSHLDFVDKSLFYQFVCRTMFSFAGSFWVLVCTCMCCVFGSIIRYLFRFRVEDSSRKMDLLRERQIGSDCFENSEADENNGKREGPVITETASTANTSKYQFICGKDFRGFIEEPETLSFTVQEFYAGSNDGSISNSPDPNTEKDIRKVDLEVEDVNHVKGEDSAENFGCELNLEAEDIDHAKAEDSAERFGGGIDLEAEDSAECFGGGIDLEAENVDHSKAEDSAECFGGGIDLEAEDVDHSKAEDSTECIGTQLNLEEDDVDHAKTEDSAGSFRDEEALEEQEQEVFTQDELSERGWTGGSENTFLGNCHSSNEVSENYPFPLGSNHDLVDSGDGFIILDDVFNSVNDDPLLVGDVGEWLEKSTLLPIVTEKAGDIDKDPSMEENPKFLDQEADVKDIEDEYLELESQLQSSNDKELFSENDSRKVEDRYEEDIDLEGTNKVNSLEKSDEPSLQKSPSSSDSDDDSLWENLWEHGNLIEQLKLELKNVRTRGLPTILEESESPKIVDDLKPLKIEEKLEHKDRMEGIQKFYQRYADKMRKLDILNYQTVHAISFLQLKDPVQLNSNKTPSASALKSLLSQKTAKLRRLQDGRTLNLIRELKNDLEMIYVGQLCLSWEILQWQYGKALELQEYDPDGFRQYSEVTSEFQQFQVLVQRFIENEPFQGPRVQCYVKNRYLIHKLLQVPAIKDDCIKDKKEMIETRQDAITIAMLTEAIEKSMHVFWDFLHADKHVKGLQGNQVDLQSPADVELLMDIQKGLHKKEKKLKELLRSKNCIVKMLQKHREDRLDRSLFFAKVELRLISRALNMSRLTTDQLAWCQKKLSQINIVNRKIHVEPSFMLFP